MDAGKLVPEGLPPVGREKPLLDSHLLPAELVLMQDMDEGLQGAVSLRVPGEAAHVVDEGLEGVPVVRHDQRRLPLKRPYDYHRVPVLREDQQVEVMVPGEVGHVLR